MKVVKTVEEFFNTVNGIVDVLDETAVNTAVSLGPWLAPAVPAYLTYAHTLEYLDMPNFIAGVSGTVVEVIGLSAVATSMKYYRINRRRTVERNHLPIKVPLGAWVFYLVVALVLNVGLIWDVAPVKVIFGTALLTLLSIPASLVLAARDIMNQDLHKPKSPTEPLTEVRPKQTKSKTELLDEYFSKNPGGKVSAAAKFSGASETYVRNYLAEKVGSNGYGIHTD